MKNYDVGAGAIAWVLRDAIKLDDEPATIFTAAPPWAHQEIQKGRLL